MSLILLPFRLFFGLVFKLLTVFVVAAGILLVVGVGYFAYNYFRPTSQAVVTALAQGTVEVASDTGSGTGTVIKVGNQWQVITAAHVVGDSSTVVVASRDGRKQEARVLGADQSRDIAVISVGANQSWAPLAVNHKSSNPGSKVVTRCYFDDSPRQGVLIGPVDDSRLGDMHLAALDFVSLVTKPNANGIVALIPIEPGCSGAPLVDQNGAIVGIVVAGGDFATIAVAARTVFH